MSWIIKAGVYDPTAPLEPPHYLSTWDLSKSVQDPRQMEWTTDQAFAHRFDDRNEAVRVALAFPICAYDDAVRVVRLRPKSVAIVSETEGKDPKVSNWDGDCG